MKSKKTPIKSKKKEKLTFYKNIIEHISTLNSSKFFTGLVMLTLNISSKYVSLGLSESQEDYLKYSLGRQILVFAILWMGTRDIVVALLLTCVFILFADYLFNDNSMFCVIPQNYTEKVKNTEKKQITSKQVNDAINVLKVARQQKGKKQNKSELKDLYIYKGLYKENFI